MNKDNGHNNLKDQKVVPQKQAVYAMPVKNSQTDLHAPHP